MNCEAELKYGDAGRIPMFISNHGVEYVGVFWCKVKEEIKRAGTFEVSTPDVCNSIGEIAAILGSFGCVSMDLHVDESNKIEIVSYFEDGQEAYNERMEHLQNEISDIIAKFPRIKIQAMSLMCVTAHKNATFGVLQLRR